jgi:glycosyltransferase involved in cell wall biosynthesis
MISFIIPTLWKSEYIYDTIGAIQASAFSEIELIIIDNANSDFESSDNRIKVIKQPENIYVNPAWNLGVSVANNKYVCLLNDDVYFNIDLFVKSFNEQVINTEHSKNFGILAYQPGTSFANEINQSEDLLILRDLNIKGTGFGQVMLFEKDLYEPIDNDIRVFYGDDLIYYLFKDILKRNIYYFEGIKIIGKSSVTSSSLENLIQEELELFYKNAKLLQDKHRP